MARKSTIRETILKAWDGHLDCTAKEIRDEVIAELGSKKSRDGRYPGLRLVQKILHDARTDFDRVVKEDKPWTLGSLLHNEFPLINEEALPFLVELAENARKEDKPLTIREAQWAARLWPFVKNRMTLKLSNPGLLLWWARHYANSERLHIILHRDFETSDYDRMISRYAEEFTVAPFIWAGLVKEKGEEWASAFFRYCLLLTSEDDAVSKIGEERLGQELLKIDEVLGGDAFETYLETWRGIAKSQINTAEFLLSEYGADRYGTNVLNKLKESEKYFDDLYERVIKKSGESSGDLKK